MNSSFHCCSKNVILYLGPTWFISNTVNTEIRSFAYSVAPSAPLDTFCLLVEGVRGSYVAVSSISTVSLCKCASERFLITEVWPNQSCILAVRVEHGTLLGEARVGVKGRNRWCMHVMFTTTQTSPIWIKKTSQYKDKFPRIPKL